MANLISEPEDLGSSYHIAIHSSGIGWHAAIYLCMSCYVPMNPGWNKIMPEGYEDVRSLKELRARKQQLDESGAPPSQQYQYKYGLTRTAN
ncbi:hypothetical protein KCV07_g41, partial [Aureobasidium melanogenum]